MSVRIEIAAALGAAIFATSVAGCSDNQADKESNSATPAVTATLQADEATRTVVATTTATARDRATSTATQVSRATPTDTPRVIITPTPRIERDQQGVLLKDRLNQADKGDEVNIATPPQIFTIARLPHIDGRISYIATLGEVVNGRTEAIAIFRNASCVHDLFEREGVLGSDSQGVWVPERHIEGLRGEVAVPKSIVSPYPIIDLESIQDKGTLQPCPPNPPGRIDWGKVPGDVSRLFGSVAREIIEGFREGFQRN